MTPWKSESWWRNGHCVSDSHGDGLVSDAAEMLHNEQSRLCTPPGLRLKDSSVENEDNIQAGRREEAGCMAT